MQLEFWTLKNKETSNLPCLCDQCVTKYQNVKFKEEKYFVNKVETQLREKPRNSTIQKTKLVTRQ
jgi:uncharacterized membrane protein